MSRFEKWGRCSAFPEGCDTGTDLSSAAGGFFAGEGCGAAPIFVGPHSDLGVLHRMTSFKS